MNFLIQNSKNSNIVNVNMNNLRKINIFSKCDIGICTPDYNEHVCVPQTSVKPLSLSNQNSLITCTHHPTSI